MTTQIPTLYLILAAVIGIFIGLLLASLFATRDTHPKQEPPTELVREGLGRSPGYGIHQQERRSWWKWRADIIKSLKR